MGISAGVVTGYSSHGSCPKSALRTTRHSNSQLSKKVGRCRKRSASSNIRSERSNQAVGLSVRNFVYGTYIGRMMRVEALCRVCGDRASGKFFYCGKGMTEFLY